MTEFKNEWSEKHGKEWIYQCEETEQSYKEFMREQAKTDAEIPVDTKVTSTKVSDKYEKQ